MPLTLAGVFASSGTHNFLPESVSLLQRVFQRAIAVDDDIRDRQSLRIAHLRIEPVHGLFAGQSPQFHEPIDAGFGVRVDDDNEVERMLRINPGLHQQWDVVNYHRVRIRLVSLLDKCASAFLDRGVGDGVQFLPCIGVDENDSCHRRAIERAIGSEDIRPESARYRLQRRLSWLDNAPRKFVCVNVHGAMIRKSARDRALARGYPASQSDQVHVAMLARPILVG